MYLTSNSPEHDCLHVDFADDDAVRCAAGGAVLTLTTPRQILRAARDSGRPRCDWVVWGIERMPMNERRIASFIVALERRIGGTLWIVLDESQTRRAARIAGHLRRCGCEAAPARLSLSTSDAGESHEDRDPEEYGE